MVCWRMLKIGVYPLPNSGSQAIFWIHMQMCNFPMASYSHCRKAKQGGVLRKPLEWGLLMFLSNCSAENAHQSIGLQLDIRMLSGVNADLMKSFSTGKGMSLPPRHGVGREFEGWLLIIKWSSLNYICTGLWISKSALIFHHLFCPVKELCEEVQADVCIRGKWELWTTKVASWRLLTVLHNFPRGAVKTERWNVLIMNTVGSHHLFITSRH